MAVAFLYSSGTGCEASDADGIENKRSRELPSSSSAHASASARNPQPADGNSLVSENKEALTATEKDWIFVPSDCSVSKKYLDTHKEEFLRALSFWKNYLLTHFQGDIAKTQLHLPFPPGTGSRFRESMESSKPGYTAFTNFVKTHFGERFPDGTVELVRNQRLWKLASTASTRLDVPISWCKGMVKLKPMKLVWLLRKIQVNWNVSPYVAFLKVRQLHHALCKNKLMQLRKLAKQKRTLEVNIYVLITAS